MLPDDLVELAHHFLTLQNTFYTNEHLNSLPKEEQKLVVTKLMRILKPDWEPGVPKKVAMSDGMEDGKLEGMESSTAEKKNKKNKNKNKNRKKKKKDSGDSKEELGKIGQESCEKVAEGGGGEGEVDGNSEKVQ